jgi:hypothetical protein
MQTRSFALALTLAVELAGGSLAAQPGAADEPATRLYWGDTHVHTSYSLDANLFNNLTLGPEAAYRFARGEEITTGQGGRARLERPLDFLVVSDHAAYMGVFKLVRENDPAVGSSESARKIAKLMADNPIFGPEQITELNQLFGADDSLGTDPIIRRRIWDEVVDVAERMNTPGRFSAIVGYEWGSTPDGNNLHRNVLFRDDAEHTRQIVPFSVIDGDTPEKLWAFLERYEQETGGQAFAIPHNSNLSNGLMFAAEDSSGSPIDAAYARTRARYEPLVEVTQIKGDSETHPFLSPDDEFADYETWDQTNIFGLLKTEPEMHTGSYARAALKNGLLIQSKVGINPFHFGMIGSTDSHTSLATADEDNFWGKTSNMPPGSDRMKGVFITARPPDAVSTLNWEQAASGYAGVWARENTRKALFDALRRREAYATTGPRMQVRFFGGWRFEDADAEAPDLAGIGYAKGVPMGGELRAEDAAGAAPGFLLAVGRDPESAGLQRLQIVKGWLDGTGNPQERVVDVRVAEDELEGASQLVAVWRDPDFDATQLAFYYARAIEMPTLRWTAIDAARYGTPIAGMRIQHQERAYTSPIWYTPAR